MNELFNTTRHYVEEHPGSAVQQIDFVLFDDETATMFQRTFQQLFL